MKLRIDEIFNHGDASKEHVAMTVLEDTNLHYYVVADTTYTGKGTVSNTFRHFMWFPSTDAKKGERVSLWSGKGKNTRVTAKDGTVWHRFYWGSEAPIWNDDGDAAVLLHVESWKTTKAK
ncbi:hypothetical protein GCM10009552_15840 [Rothia nasimurium]|uniref:Uncharacterized protein n=1 Tax=Luteibacter anthropi TaxID=564369 RepID=A0A7X5UB40_9GAMM|nr:hypothetical protein [Luteibacter anthropi]NII07246.1 hypothetical protein [Luteibacter anthropi]